MSGYPAHHPTSTMMGQLGQSHMYTMGSTGQLLPYAMPGVREVDVFTGERYPSMDAIADSTKIVRTGPSTMSTLPGLSDGKLQVFQKAWLRLFQGYAGEGISRIFPLALAKETTFVVYQPIVHEMILDEGPEGAPPPQSSTEDRSRQVTLRRFHGAQQSFWEALFRSDGNEKFMERVNACVRAFGHNTDKVFLTEIMRQQTLATCYTQAFSQSQSVAGDYIDILCNTFFAGVKPSARLLETALTCATTVGSMVGSPMFDVVLGPPEMNVSLVHRPEYREPINTGINVPEQRTPWNTIKTIAGATSLTLVTVSLPHQRRPADDPTLQQSSLSHFYPNPAKSGCRDMRITNLIQGEWCEFSFEEQLRNTEAFEANPTLQNHTSAPGSDPNYLTDIGKKIFGVTNGKDAACFGQLKSIDEKQMKLVLRSFNSAPNPTALSKLVFYDEKTADLSTINLPGTDKVNDMSQLTDADKNILRRFLSSPLHLTTLLKMHDHGIYIPLDVVCIRPQTVFLTRGLTVLESGGRTGTVWTMMPIASQEESGNQRLVTITASYYVGVTIWEPTNIINIPNVFPRGILGGGDCRVMKYADIEKSFDPRSVLNKGSIFFTLVAPGIKWGENRYLWTKQGTDGIMGDAKPGNTRGNTLKTVGKFIERTIESSRNVISDSLNLVNLPARDRVIMYRGTTQTRKTHDSDYEIAFQNTTCLGEMDHPANSRLMTGACKGVARPVFSADSRVVISGY